MTSLIGRTLGSYSLLEQIGHGGMANVYKAYDPAQDRVVAIKILSPLLARVPQFSERFRRESRVVMQLNYPNIVPVVDFGEVGGYAYMVMPYLRVGSLTERLKHGRLTLAEGIRLIEQIAGALDFAHHKRVVHRDVKPSNILLDEEGNALLSDFGLAHVHDASVNLTGSALLGTPAYISPEQARGDEVDPRSDQYSLGIVLFELTTGRVPYEAETPMAVLLQHVSEPLPLPRTIVPNLPEPIERVILKATAKNPNDRFARVAEMNEALQAALANVQDPQANAPPEIRLHASKAGTQVLPASQKESSGRGFPSRRMAAIVAVIFLLTLAYSVASSSPLDRLMRASSPAESSDILVADTTGVQLTAQAGTIEAMPKKMASTPQPAPVIEPAPGVPVQDSFDSDIGTFRLGQGMEIHDGAFFLGPFEGCAADAADFDSPIDCNAVCQTCGASLRNYDLEVEFSFEEGVSDRSSGVILRFVDVDGDSMLDYEDYLLVLGFNTFTSKWIIYVHVPDRVSPWHVVKQGPAGLRGVGLPNRIEATASNQGRLIDIFLNKARIVKLTADVPQPGETFIEHWADSGAVGFVALGRRVKARYDNFLFEPLP